LTPGGFYGHFASKEELIGEALDLGGDRADCAGCRGDKSCGKSWKLPRWPIIGIIRRAAAAVAAIAGSRPHAGPTRARCAGRIDGWPSLIESRLPAWKTGEDRRARPSPSFR